MTVQWDLLCPGAKFNFPCWLFIERVNSPLEINVIIIFCRTMELT
jgi:hypothetical protein